MSDIGNLLVDLRGRAENDSYHGYLYRQAADEIVRLRDENAKLREALRKFAIDVFGRGIKPVLYGTCHLCNMSWRDGEAEVHAPDCLAAPKVKT